jgi:hypothetical protein
VQTQRTLRVLGGRGDLHDRNAGGVGGQHRVGVGDDPAEFAEDLGLDGLVLDDGLDHQLPVGQVIQVGGEGELAKRAVALALGHLARADATLQGLHDAVASRCDERVGGLEHRHADTGADGDLGDTGSPIWPAPTTPTRWIAVSLNVVLSSESCCRAPQ